MEFSRLRLAGFKSFVDPTDFIIEPGLTGIVGPNGCGKSNLFEALRWVMGANSAKALRGEGMEDVIFAGSRDRPPRNHAEVTLTIDNSDRTAPARFNLQPVLEVVRRIDRGEGSSYRINGVDVRARDVQLLFADASTGANSPALVRQGQISELISAKPQNRRRILEEAAGVSGLHGRRHEAEIRVRAADSNLARIDDLARELESNLARLRREARAAARYKTLAAEIRALRGAVLHARWREAHEALERLTVEGASADLAAAQAAGAVATATATAIAAQAAIGPLRDEETAAAAVQHHLEIEKDRLERAIEAAATEAIRLQADLLRIEADFARERQIVDDAKREGTRAGVELGELRAAIADAPQHTPQLRTALAAAETTRAQAEAAVEALATQAAAQEADHRAAQARLEDALARLARTARALERARADRAAIGPPTDPRLELSTADLSAAERDMQQATESLETAETGRTLGAKAEDATRRAARSAEDDLARLTVEARGLMRLTAEPAAGQFPPVLDHLTPARGLEAALAAALGDDLNAALDALAPAHWAGSGAGAETTQITWPEGATPLAPLIDAPPQLAARLALTALVNRVDGAAMQARLSPGARLVSRQGDLWRWDGFTVTAEAPRPAQVRLEQKTRLTQLQAEIEQLTPKVAEARAKHAVAAQTHVSADTQVHAAREAVRLAQARAARAREAVEALAREGARRDARAQSLDETIASFTAEAAEANEALDAAQVRVDETPLLYDLAQPLAAARQEAVQAREAAATARAALDQEVRAADDRARRLESLERIASDWSARAEAAHRRQESLTTDQAKTTEALEGARSAPQTVEARRQQLMDELAASQARRAKSSDALAVAEAARAQADRQARTAEAAAADAREARASLNARLDAARERLTEQASAIAEALGLEPEALGQQLAGEGVNIPRVAGEGVNIPRDAGAVEARLASLERDREAIGAVNLRAEEEVTELAARLATMNAERNDLTGALSRLRAAINELNAEGRERLLAAFEVIDQHFRSLFMTLFQGGQAELRLVESEDPLEAGLEIFACPPGKRLAVMSLMSGGEQALTAVALIFAVFLANPAPICVLDEVDAPLDDANVGRFCDLLEEMRTRASTRFITITHNPVTMSRMDRLFGVTMRDKGISQLVSVDLHQAEALAAL